MGPLCVTDPQYGDHDKKNMEFWSVYAQTGDFR
jgi:hypothetical protein